MKTRKTEKKPLHSLMTVGESLIWAATYAIEYNRWTCGDEHAIAANTKHEVKAARTAMSQAAMAVLAGRAAFGEIKGTSPDMVARFAEQMGLALKPKKKRRPRV
jgi:hypothetical protein